MQNYTDMFRLDGRVAVVTGAGFGFGRAFALGLAAFGATVVCADRDMPNAEETVGLARQSHGKAAAAHVDIAEETSVDAFWDRLRAEHGGLDILINNAGVTSLPTRTHELSIAEWDRVTNINLRGVFLCTRRALPMMMARKRGSIINIASIAGLLGYYPDFARLAANYSAAKAGVIGLTRQAAAEYAADGIRVNAIAPGWHGGTNLGAASRGRWTSEQTARAEAAIHAGIPMGRRGTPDDLVGLAVYLASDASSYLTGQVIAHDGGWSAV
jgi:NAD(P)-dependent dehydrogenase (short-subunit alcohol dehydrogenase family)